MLHTIWAAFSFLSILVPGKAFTQETMQRSVVYFPLVGLILGVLTSFISYCALYTSHAMLGTILYCTLMFFLTRGLHYDGLADLADAWGSHQRGERFRQILKDSHIGSFGVVILILYILSYSMTLSIIFTNLLITELSQNTRIPFLFLLVFAPCWGRIGCLMFPAFSHLYIPQQSTGSSQSIQPLILSGIMGNTHSRFRFFLWFIPASLLLCIILTWIQFIIILITSFASFFILFLLAKREHGYNGDFLGAICLLWELSIFLSIYF